MIYCLKDPAGKLIISCSGYGSDCASDLWKYHGGWEYFLQSCSEKFLISFLDKGKDLCANSLMAWREAKKLGWSIVPVTIVEVKTKKRCAPKK
jgi:hypothetical protein